MSSDKRGPWTIKSTKPIYSNPWIQIKEHQVTQADGADGIYGEVKFAHRALGVVAINDEGQVVLVGQHRFPNDCYSWEIPEGGGRQNESPLAAIQRELQEETGFQAKNWTMLAEEIMLSNSVTDELAWIYLATDLIAGHSNPEGCEVLEVKQMPFQQAIDQVIQGEIRDSISVMGLLLAERHLSKSI